MTRGRKIAAWILGGVAALVIVAVTAGILIVRTEWFRNFVRAKIVTAVEEATGGKVDVGSFNFEWSHLRAQIHDFVIHGLEPPTAAPLLRVDLLQVDLKLLSPFRGFVDIAYLLADTPQANVIVYTDGHTNIPAPKIQHPTNRTGLETVVDLKIGRFDLRKGSFTFGDRKSSLDASGGNLRAMLNYNPLKPSYTGELDIDPLDVKSGNNPAVPVSVKLPVTLEKDRISLAEGRLSTPQSQIVISGAMDHLVAPRASAHLNARIALDEVKRAAGLAVPLDTLHGPRLLEADVTASTDPDYIRIQSARVRLGSSNIEASGTLQDPQQAGTVQFNSTLALSELGRLLRVAAQPEGVLKAGGNTRLESGGRYVVTGNVEGRGVAFRMGANRLAGISLDTSVTADPHRIELAGLRLDALGGSFHGSAGIEEMDKFQLQGNLSHFQIEQVVRVFRPGQLGYNGVVSGPVAASGRLKNGSELIARANLGIAPGAGGEIPVSGHLQVDYNGAAGDVAVDHSYLGLPHSRLDLTGTLNRQIQVRLVTHDMADFRPVAAIPVSFTAGSGSAIVNATVAGKLDAPRIAAQVELANFAVDDRPFTRFSGAVDASPSGADIRNGLLTRGSLQAQLTASVGLRNWKPEPAEPLRVDATVRNADVRDILALAGQSAIPASGAFTADAHIAGTIGSPTGNADIGVVNGTVEDQPFDRLSAHVDMTDRRINVPTLQLTAGAGRIDASASFQHPLNDLKRGEITAHAASSQIQLGQLQALVKNRPGLNGTLSLRGDAAASLTPDRSGSQVEVRSVDADLAARNLQMQGQALGNLTATAKTAGSEVQYRVDSNFAGSTIDVRGQSLLTGNHSTTATAHIANLPVDRVLVLAGRGDVPVSGNLAATVNYADTEIDVPQMRLDDGPNRIELTASFRHPAGDFQDGDVRFRLNSSALQLARIRAIQQRQPGLAGIISLNADGAARLRRNATPLVSALNANLAATQIAANGKNLGDLKATATTRGNELAFDLNSDLAQADIRGNGTLQLAGDYPVNARLSFSKVTYAGLRPLLSGSALPLDAELDGRATVSGPVTQIAGLRGSVVLTRVDAHSVAPARGRKPRVTFDLHNAGDVSISLDRSTVTIQSFRLTGPETNLALAGTASLANPRTINVRATGDVRLDLLEAFDPDIFSSGRVTLNANVTGTVDQPSVLGRLQLQNASFNLLSLPNGISNANGIISFNGTQAQLQNITGETGGGKVTLAGFISYGGPEMQFRVDATATGVHIEQPDITVAVGARLTLAGSTSDSLLSGNVGIHEVAMHSHSDIGSILTSAATPPTANTPSTGLLGGMRFDVRIRTAPDIQFRTTLTRNLEAEANLTLRGTPDHPGMLGRVTATEGDVVFFGAKYSIDQGTVAFYDPNRINPNLNIDLSTTVQGVDVSLSVSGPMDRLKLAYHSDPPMAFSDIASLLASGKLHATDPVLAARQPPALEQNFGQAGASTLLGQAVANPVSGRLQRLFGVSKLAINPQIIGTSNTATATMTLQQQITRELTFTYISDLSQANPQVIRMEWSISPQWSAVAQRDEYGMFDLDFFYKKRFH
jgi:translocation and assembly module TamB